MIRLEVGKYYRTRDGLKVGPVKLCAQGAWDTGEPLVEIDDEKSRLYRAKTGQLLFPENGGSDIVSEWEDSLIFEVGSKVRRSANPHAYVPVGYESTVLSIDNGRLWYIDFDGLKRASNPKDWALVSPTLTDGPVRTVTRREVVPGHYGIVKVKQRMPQFSDRLANVAIQSTHASADELRAAAAVLLELAGALSDE